MIPEGFGAPDEHGAEVCNVIFTQLKETSASPASFSLFGLPIFFVDPCGDGSGRLPVDEALGSKVGRDVAGDA
jgi:hypothetical protein